MKNDYSCGVVPYRVVDGRREYLLVRHHAGHWAFPKGHPDDGETPLDTAAREFREETGITTGQPLASPAFEEQYVFIKRSGKKVRKRVTYYLCEVEPTSEVVVQPEEIVEYAWDGAAGTRRRITFEEGRELFDEVEAYFAGGLEA